MPPPDSSYDSDDDEGLYAPGSDIRRIPVKFKELSKPQLLEVLTKLNENDIEYSDLKVSRRACCESDAFCS